MKSRTLWSSLLALAVAAPAVAAGAPGDPQQRHTKADISLAASVLLNTSAFGGGWKAASGAGSGRLSCDSAATPNQSDLVETGSAAGPLFSHQPYQAVAQSAQVFTTKAQTDTAWARAMAPKLVLCMEEQVENTSSMGAPVTVTAWYRLRFAPLVQHAAGYRVVALATTGKKTKTTVYLDVLLFGRDRTITTVVLSALKTPFSKAFEQGLARKVAAQLSG